MRMRADPVSELARSVSTRWARCRRAPTLFPRIAAEALCEMHDRFDAKSLVRSVFARRALPAQTSLTEAFGEPPVTLYRASDFYIELLLWHSGTTGIHEHRFRGAFLVVEGASLETRYRFVERQHLGRGFAVGDLELAHTEVLGVGDVREILAHRRLIHSVFHLNSPSATLVVRTHAFRGIEWEYRYPHVAIDPKHRPAHTTKRLQLLNLMARTDWGDYANAACEAIAREEVVGAFQIASRARLHLSRSQFARVATAMRRRHPAVAEPLLRVAEEERRKWLAISLRERVTEANVRFFLGLLISVPDREHLLAMLASRYRDNNPRACLQAFQRTLAPLLRGSARELYARIEARS